jgi:hypothetical protein
MNNKNSSDKFSVKLQYQIKLKSLQCFKYRVKASEKNPVSTIYFFHVVIRSHKKQNGIRKYVQYSWNSWKQKSETRTFCRLCLKDEENFKLLKTKWNHGTYTDSVHTRTWDRTQYRLLERSSHRVPIGNCAYLYWKFCTTYKCTAQANAEVLTLKPDSICSRNWASGQ